MTEYEELAVSIHRRFYEPIILADALKSVFLEDNHVSDPDLEADNGKSPKQTYYCFLNKLAQICDSQPKQALGKTVSAIVVLDSGTIEYRFASNQRDSRELDTVKTYLTDIINTLGHAPDDEIIQKTVMEGVVFSEILRKVLTFNRPRIELYIEDLCRGDNLAFCIESSAGDGTTNVAQHAEVLLKTLASNYEFSLENYMRTKTRGEKTLYVSPWNDVRHSLGRLLSYHIAIKVLITARQSWPQLFVDFEVTTIPSTLPLTDSRSIRRTAKGIIQRMGRGQSTLDALHQMNISLQLNANTLDKRIKDRVTNFHPIVHAEVNLLSSVLQSQSETPFPLYDDDEDEDFTPPRFFNESSFPPYIGSSKPTCLLCSLYFRHHPSGILCRETHGNLYPNWRAPDVTVSEGSEAVRRRSDILEGMIKDVRNVTGRAIKEKTCSWWKRHDSRDTPSNPLGASTRAGGSTRAGEKEKSAERNIDAELELAMRMGQISLVGSSARSREKKGEKTSAAGKGSAGEVDVKEKLVVEPQQIGQIGKTARVRGTGLRNRTLLVEETDDDAEEGDDSGGARL
ncbi:hypothetical protein N0V88_007543 [Collariella sp. IMI 366227]|nr:hypothetical protein N0V88_007543 [Collariella sp. IMI 366227]